MKGNGTASGTNKGSRAAATAPSCGRQPADRIDQSTPASREAAAAVHPGTPLSPLRGLYLLRNPITCGLTPAATCWRRFAAWLATTH